MTELMTLPGVNDVTLDGLALLRVLITMTVSSVGLPLVPVKVLISVVVVVKVPDHGSVVVVIKPATLDDDGALDELTLLGVLITITVSSVGLPLVPVKVLISVVVVVKVPDLSLIHI